MVRLSNTINKIQSIIPILLVVTGSVDDVYILELLEVGSEVCDAIKRLANQICRTIRQYYH